MLCWGFVFFFFQIFWHNYKLDFLSNLVRIKSYQIQCIINFELIYQLLIKRYFKTKYTINYFKCVVELYHILEWFNCIFKDYRYTKQHFCSFSDKGLGNLLIFCVVLYKKLDISHSSPVQLVLLRWEKYKWSDKKKNIIMLYTKI